MKRLASTGCTTASPLTFLLSRPSAPGGEGGVVKTRGIGNRFRIRRSAIACQAVGWSPLATGVQC